MHISRLLKISILLLVSATLHAQNIEDALRYSYLNPQGSARSIAVGGAMGALGADFTAIGINPAGVGAYWKSEVAFTPSWFSLNTKSSLNGGPTNSQLENKFNLATAGVVFANEGREGSAWKSVSLGISNSKVAQYNQSVFYQGATAGSIVERFALLSDNLTPEELGNFETGLAWDVFAINDFNDDLIYENDYDAATGTPLGKEESIFRSGAYNDLNISLGANLKDKILMGFAVGVPFLHYESENVYVEADDANDIPIFNNLQYTKNLLSDGAGINVKLGAIWKVNSDLRVGLAYHTPTYLAITESFTSQLTYSFNETGEDETNTSASPQGDFEYGLTTPWRAIGSASYLIAKRGFVSADVEFVNYGAAKFDFTRNSDNLDDLNYQTEVNQQISDAYRATFNIRVGGEMTFNALRARAGVQLLGSPFENDTTLGKIYSAGIGYRGNKAYIDAAYVLSQEKVNYSPYQIQQASLQLVENRENRGRIAVTIGFKI